VVRADDDQAVVEALDREVVLGVTGRGELKAVAAGAAARLEAVLASRRAG